MLTAKKLSRLAVAGQTLGPGQFCGSSAARSTRLQGQKVKTWLQGRGRHAANQALLPSLLIAVTAIDPEDTNV